MPAYCPISSTVPHTFTTPTHFTLPPHTSTPTAGQLPDSFIRCNGSKYLPVQNALLVFKSPRTFDEQCASRSLIHEPKTHSPPPPPSLPAQQAAQAILSSAPAPSLSPPPPSTTDPPRPRTPTANRTRFRSYYKVGGRAFVAHAVQCTTAFPYVHSRLPLGTFSHFAP